MSTVSSCPALLLCTSQSKMESFVESNVSKQRLLEPPSITDSNSEEEDVKPTIKPRLSPLPRRRSSVSSDEGDLEPPTSGARKVSFADAFGFDLVSVKEFDTWEIPTVSQDFVKDSIKIEEFYLTQSFILPSVGGIMERLYARKVTLESVDFIPGTTSMKGIIRVLNLSYDKHVYVRMTLDDWQSYHDLLAEYVPDSCNGETDQFFFTISLVSPYQKEGASVEFCICYETADGTFWDNNEGHNYVLTCHKKECLVEVESHLEDVTEKNKKSCLKPVPSKEEEDLDVYEAESSTATERYIPTIICSYDAFAEDNNEKEKAHKSEKKNNEEENDLELFLSQRLMKARITSSEEKNNTGYSEESTLPKEGQLDDEIKFYSDRYSSTVGYHIQEPEECDNTGVCLPLAEATPSLTDEDLISVKVADYHCGDHDECLYEIEEKALSLDHPVSTKQRTNLVQISPDVKDYIPQRESEKWSMVEWQNEDITNKHFQETSETTSFPQAEAMQLTEMLDDNANLSYSQNIANVPYFSTDDTERIKYEQRDITKTETIEHRMSDNNSIYNPKENDELLMISTDNMKQECHISFSQSDVSRDLSNNTVFHNEHTVSKEASLSIASPDDLYLFTESQVMDTGEELSQNTHLMTSFCKDAKTVVEIPEISDEKEHIITETDTDLSDSQAIPTLLSKQYYVTTQDSTTSCCDDKNGEIYNKDVVLSENGEQYDFKYPLYKEEEIYTCETERTSLGSCDNDNTEKELSHQPVSLLECPSSVTSSAAENVTHSTLHTWNKILGCIPSDMTQGNKVIIAKITEEKGQSQTHSQGREDSKPSYMDICDRGNLYPQEEIAEESEQKYIPASETSIELSNEKNVDIHMSIGSMSVDKNQEGEQINTSKFKYFSEDIIHTLHEGDKYVSKEQYELQFEPRSNSSDEESNVHQSDAEPITQSNNSFAALSDDIDMSLRDDCNVISTDKNEAVELKDLPELTITERSINIDTVQASVGDVIVGPSILISEPDDEGVDQCSETEEQNKLEYTQYYYHSDDYETEPHQQTQSDTEAAEPLNINHVSSKVLCFIMFVVFSGLMYHYDFLVCFALYLFSLYWLYWEGDRGEKPVRKE
ncbi:protein phosphatase 1 regulatory subunit 3A [Pseudophryne corroboree]|uniref:protein phosphatase 1 regulatory subunit 3A n=1 Tax=Pseudophryne corroboree TaxID=495146 RepID=UPI00308171D2